jgi:hypothetical protein
MTTGNYSSSARRENPRRTIYIVENLAPGRTYYYAATAFNGEAPESNQPDEGSRNIPDDDRP